MKKTKMKNIKSDKKNEKMKKMMKEILRGQQKE